MIEYRYLLFQITSKYWRIYPKWDERRTVKLLVDEIA